MTAEIHNTKVNLSGLLEVLGKNLYSTPFVALRELVQNAHDACSRRKIESSDPFQPKIHIEIKYSDKQIIITDNGAGLTDSEIDEHLATIGSGYTRLLRQHTDSQNMIGYFGLGFLTAYVLADKVEMVTTSYQAPNLGWHFISSGGQRYSIQPCAARDVGSQIILKLNKDYYSLLEFDLLESLLRKYCGLLEIPIFLNHAESPSNDLKAPWKNSVTSPIKYKKDLIAFAQIFETNYEVLAALPIIPTKELNVNGTMWIQGGGSYATSDQRNVNVYVRGMQISDQLAELLPNWAGFTGCTVDSPDLIPTASREDIQKDHVYEKLKIHLHNNLIAGLKHIANHETATWRRIVSRHNEALLGAAIADEGLFQVLHKDLKIPTSDGELTIDNIKQQSQGTLRVALEEHGGYEEILCRAQRIPVISGYRFGAMSFTKLYCETYNFPLAILGTQKGNNSLFRQVESSDRIRDKLTTLFCQHDEKLVTCEFDPTYLPLIIVPDEESVLKKRMEDDDMDKKVSKAVLSLARNYTDTLSADTRAYVYINLSSTLVQKLLTLEEVEQSRLAKLLRSFVNLMSNKLHDHQTTMAHELEHYHSALMSIIED